MFRFARLITDSASPELNNNFNSVAFKPAMLRFSTVREQEFL